MIQTKLELAKLRKFYNWLHYPLHEKRLLFMWMWLTVPLQTWCIWWSRVYLYDTIAVLRQTISKVRPIDITQSIHKLSIWEEWQWNSTKLEHHCTRSCESCEDIRVTNIISEWSQVISLDVSCWGGSSVRNGRWSLLTTHQFSTS